MRIKIALSLITITITGLFISSCGPGQLLGPTITPSPSITPTNTQTFTPTPVPVSEILKNNQFVRDFEVNCENGEKCKSYTNMSIGMSVTIYESMKLEVRRIVISQDMAINQLIIFGEVLSSVYNEDIAAQILKIGNNPPYNGDIGEYNYELYSQPMKLVNVSYSVLVAKITPN